MTADQTKYDSITFHVDSPEGTVNVVIAEQSPGKIGFIHIFVGKSGSAVRSLTDALARMVTFALENKALTDVIAELSNITTDKARYTKGGVTVRSIPEALYVALLRYRNMYAQPSLASKGEYRPVKFANPKLADM